MIVEPSVPELLKKAENRYALVIMTSKRARQLAAGAEPKIELSDEKEKPVTIAAEEIAAGEVVIEE